jgi:hypothetical protein
MVGLVVAGVGVRVAQVSLDHRADQELALLASAEDAYAGTRAGDIGPSTTHRSCTGSHGDQGSRPTTSDSSCTVFGDVGVPLEDTSWFDDPCS